MKKTIFTSKTKEVKPKNKPLEGMILEALEPRIAPAATFTFAGSGASSVDTNPATHSHLTASGADFLTDINISVSISAPYADDVDIFLVHDGVTVQVYNGIGDTSGSTINATFDDAAAAFPPANGTVSGTFRPNPGVLSAFNGHSLAGDWDLVILDLVVPNDHTNLNSWSITGTSAPVDLTAALDGSGNLVLTESNGAHNDAILAKTQGGAFVFTDPTHAFGTTGIAGATVSADQHTLTIPTGSVTGSGITLNTGGGDDTVTVDWSGGAFGKTLTYNGGAQATAAGDKLVITGGAQGTVTYNYTNANDGSIVSSVFGSVNYTGLEPISNSGTATDIVFNLPATANAATLADDVGGSGNGLSTLSGANFENTTFAQPTGSLTIYVGTGSDSLAIGALPDFHSTLTLGTTANPFSTVNFNGALTLGANALDVHAGTSITVGASIAAGTTTLNAGTINLNAALSGTVLGTTATVVNVTSPGEIQDGVDVAAIGATVNVGAGSYLEDVALNKAGLHLLGAGAATTTIVGKKGGDSATVRISASNLELAGFTITREGNNTTDWTDPTLNSAGIAIQGLAVTGALIHDNILTGNRSALDVNNSGGHTIRNNVVDNNHTGLIFRNQTDDLTVVENTITNNRTVGILFLDGSGGTNVPVQSAANSTFSNNNLSGNWYGQIVDRQAGGSLPAPGTTNLKDFSGNWFGTTAPVVTTANSAEPGYAALIPVAFGGTATAPGGQPDIAGAGSANFDITPFLGSGTDTNVETTPGRGTFGFQGSVASLYVTAQGAQVGTTGRIQEGVNKVATGGTVRVGAGTFDGSVFINKTLSLLGVQAGVDARTRVGAETIVRGDLTGGGTRQTAVWVQANDVTVDGFTVDGSTYEPLVGAGVYLQPGTAGTHFSDNIVQNNIIGLYLANNSATKQTVIEKNLFRNNTAPGAASGTDVYADEYSAGGPVQNVLIQNNTFTNTAFVEDAWALGISNTSAPQFSNITVSNNSISNHGRGMYFFASDGVTISGNTIDGASRYGIGLFGIDGVPANTNFTITGNTITNSLRGVWVSDDTTGAAYTGTLTITNGTFTNVTTPVEDESTAVVVIAGITAFGSANATIISDDVHFTGGANSVTGTGILTIKPTSDTVKIGLGSDTAAAVGAGGLLLNDGDLAALANGFAGIVIGNAGTGAHQVFIDGGGASDVTFKDPLTINTPAAGGHITVTGRLVGTDNATITFNGSGATTTLSADVVTAGTAIAINDSVQLGASVLLDTTNGGGVPAGATIGITGAIDLVNKTLTWNAGATATSIATVISGAGGSLTKLGTGTLTLSNNNAYTGTTTVNAGTLQAAGTNTPKGAIGSSSSIIVNNGGTISSSGSASINNDNGMFGTSSTAIITVNAGGLISIIGGLTQHVPAVVLNGGTLSVIGAVSGSAVTYGNWNFDQGVSTSGAGVTSTITGGAASLTQTGGTVFNVGAGDTLNVSTVLVDIVSGPSLALVKSGTGMLVLSGANTYTGATGVQNGKLQLSGGANRLNPVTTVTVGGGNGTAPIFDLNGQNQSIAGLVFGSNVGSPTGAIAGAVTTGVGTLTLTGNISTANGSITNTHTLSGNLNLGGATRTIAVVDAGPATDLSISAVVSNGSISKSGAGTLLLGAANSYAGGTTVTQGTLALGNNAALGATTALLTVSGGTVNLAGFSPTVTGLSDGTGQTGTGTGGVVTTTSGTPTLTIADASRSFGGTIAGAVNIAVTGGAGYQIFNGANTYTGTTVVNNALEIWSANGLGATGAAQGTTVNNGGSLSFKGASNPITFAAEPLILNGTGSLLLNTDSTLKTATFPGAITLSAGANATIGGGSSVGTLNLSGGITGGGGFTKTGNTITVNLTNTNTYTGATQVSGGTLLINGSVTSNVTVSSPATLGGGGTITGNVNGNGTVAPGNSPGTLTIMGNFTPTGTLAFEVNSPYNTAGTDYDQIVVSGTVNLSGATLTFAGGGAAPTAGQLLTLINKTSAGATSASVNPAEGATVSIGGTPFKIFYNGGDGNNVVLVDASTPLVTYVEDTAWTGFTNGMVIADADFGTAGNQPAVYGVNAFSTVANGLSAVTASGNVIVNDGTYAEAVALSGTKTLTVTGGATVTTNSFASIAGTTLAINGTGLVTGDATSTAIAGLISGTGNLTKVGAGTLTLSGANTFTGVTKISGGVLSVSSLANGGVTSNLGQATNVAANLVLDGGTLLYTGPATNTDKLFTLTQNGGTLDSSGTGELVFTNTGAIAFTGSGARTLTLTGTDLLALGGSGEYGNPSRLAAQIGNGTGGATSLVKNGVGTWALSSPGAVASTYTGGTSVNVGQLAIRSGGALGTAAVNVAAGAQLAFSNVGITVANDITLNGLTTLNGNSGALVGDNLGGGGVNILTGTLTLAATSNVTTSWSDKSLTIAGKVTGPGGLQIDLYRTGNQPSQITLTNSTNDYAGNTTVNAGQLRLGASNVIPDGAGKGNVAVNGGATLVFTGDFSDTINGLSGSGTVTKNGGAGVTVLTVGGNNQTANFTGALNSTSGSLGVTKIGTGTQTLGGTGITFGGALNVNNGRLVLNEATAFANGASTTSLNIATGATLEFAVAGTHAIGSTSGANGIVISGGGTLLKTGAGLLAFDEQGTNAFKVTIQQDSGGLIDVQGGAIRNGGWQGQDWTTNKGDLNVGAGATFDIWDGNGVIVDVLTGAGTINRGNGGASTITIGADNGTGNFTGSISDAAGSVAVTKIGTGTQTLSGANNFSGTLAINGGTIKAGSATALGSTAGSTTIANGAALDLNGQTIGAENITSVLGTGVGGTGAITNSSAAAASLAGNISNGGASVGGTGDITFTGGVSNNVLTKVNANTLTISGSTDNASLILNAQGGTVNLDKSSTGGVHAVAGIADIAAGATVKLTGTGGDQIYGGSLSGANSLVNMSSGTFDLNGHSESISRVSGTGTVTNSNATSATLIVGESNGSGTNFAGTIQNGAGTTAFTKIGTGTQTLSGTNTYSGATTIAGGTLALVSTTTSNNIANSATVDVQTGATLDVTGLDFPGSLDTLKLASGQTLQGNGTVSGKLTALSGSFVSPGITTGVLIQTGDLTFTTGSTFTVQVNGYLVGTQYDQVDVTGTVALGGATLVTTGVVASTPGQEIVLIKNDGVDPVTGTFAGLAEGATLTINGTNFIISYAGGAGANDVTLTETGGTTLYSDGVGAGALELRRIGNNVQFVDDGTVVDSRPLSTLVDKVITVVGAAQTETLFVNYSASGGFFDVDVQWDAGTGAGDDDALRITGSTFDTATHTFTTGGPGHTGVIVYTTGAVVTTISYTGLEPVNMTGSTIGSLVFNLPNVADTAVLEDVGTTNDGTSQIRSLGGIFETTMFTSPTGTLTVNGGTANDTIRFDSLDTTFAAALVANGQAGTDIVTLAAGLPTHASTLITSETINLNSHTTTGAQTYTGATVLQSGTTLSSTSAGAITFAGTLNGAQTLAVNTTGATVFGGAVGGTTALTSLTTNAGGTVAINGGLIQTNGPQAFNDAVTLGANTTFGSGTTGTITFNSTLDGAFAANFSNVPTGTSGLLSFNGVVGGTTPLASLTTDVGAVSFNATTNVTGAIMVQARSGDVTIGGNINGGGFIQLRSDLGNTLRTPGVNTFTVSGPIVFVSADHGTDGNVGTAATPILTDTPNLQFRISGTGSAYITEANGAILTGNAGAIGNTGEAHLTTTTGNFTIGAVVLPDSKVFVSAPGGYITDTSNAADIDFVADQLTLSASTGIGFDGTPNNLLQINVNQLVGATTASGQIILDVQNGATSTFLANHTTSVAGVSHTGTGPIILHGTVGSGTRTFNSITANNGQITIDPAAGIAVLGGPISTTVAGNIVVSTGTGDIQVAGNVTTNNLAQLIANGGANITYTSGLVTGGTVDLQVIGGNGNIGASGTPIQIDANNTLTFNTTGSGNAFINDIDGASFGGPSGAGRSGNFVITSTTGDLTVQGTTVTTGNITVDAGQSGMGDVLRSGGATLQANTVTLKAHRVGATGGNIGTTATPIQTNATSLVFTGQGAGSVHINEANGANFTGTTGTGDIAIVSTGAGDLVNVGNVTTTGVITITTSNGNILRGGGGYIAGGTLNFTAGGANGNIGNSGNRLQLDATTNLNLSAGGSGNIYVVETIGSDVSASSGSGTIDITAGTGDWNIVTATYPTLLGAATVTNTGISTSGNVVLNTNNGAITNGNGAALNISANTAALTATTGIGTGAGGALKTALNNLEARTTTGGVFIDEADALTVGGVTGSLTGVSATTSGNIIINSGALTIAEDITVTAVNNVTLNSTATITETTGAVKTAALLTTTSVGGQTLNGANTVASFDGTNTGSGNVSLFNTAATLTIHRIANLVGNATVVNTGNIQLGDASNLNVNVSGIANISALAGAITDGNGATNNITALAAILSASNGIGTNADRIETTIANLEATGGTGGVFIAETDALTIGGISAVDGVSATGGDIKISSGALSVTEQISTPANVVLNAAGTIIESAAGRISAANLTNTSVGGETLNGNNTVGSFTATNTGAGSSISLQNDFNGFDIRDIDNRTGGTIFINNTNDFDASGENDATVTGNIRSGNPALGGDITICTSGLLTVAGTGVINSSTGTGGTLTIQDRVTILAGATITTGFGDITLKGGAGSIIITAPISVDSPLVLRATDDINILAKVETTSTLSDITITADFDNNGLGGVLIDGAGEVKAGRNVSVAGSNYLGSVRADLALLNDAVIIEPNGSASRLSALGNVFVDVNTAALAASRIWLGGAVRSIGTGNVTFDNAVLVTSNDAYATTHGAGNVIFFREVDSRGGAGSPFNLRASTDNGLVLFNGAVGATTPLGDITVDTALDVIVSSTLSARTFSVGAATGTVEFDGAVTTTGTGTNISVNTKTLVVNGTVNSTAPGAALGSIFWQTDNIAINANVSGDGQLTIQPQTANRTIGVNGAGDLNLDTAEIGRLQNGFAAIQIGRLDGSGAITTSGATFLDPVTLLSPLSGGSVSVNGTINGTDDASVSLIAPTINLNVASPAAAVSTEADTIQLTGNVKLLANTLLRTNFGGAGGNVNLDGTVNGAQSLTIDAGNFAAGGTVNFNGGPGAPGGASIGGSTNLTSLTVSAATINLLPQVITSGAQTYNAATAINAFAGALRSKVSGAITLNGPLHLNQDLPIITSGGAGADILFTSTVDGIGTTGALSLNAGNIGTVRFQGNVGSTVAPASVEVINSASIRVDGTLHAVDKIMFDSTEIDFLGGANSVGTSNGTITLQTDGISTAVLVGGAVDPGANTLHLSTTDLAALDGNSALITIARTTGTGGLIIDAGGATFRSPVEFRQSGRTGGISVLGNVTGTGNASLAFTSGATTLDANLFTSGKSIRVDNPILAAGASTITISTTQSAAAGANVTFNGSLLVAGAGAHNLTVTAGTGTVEFVGSIGTKTSKPGAVNVTAALTKIGSSLNAGSLSFTGNTELRGNLIATSGSAGQTYNGNVTLNSSIQLAAATGSILITGTVDGTGLPLASLKLATKAGAITVGGAVGGTSPLGTLTVGSVGGASTFGGAVTARSISLKAPTFSVKAVTTTGSQTFTGVGTFGGAISADTLKITSKAAITIGSAVTTASTASFQAKGFDVSVNNAANSFGRIDATARNATFSETGATSLRTVTLTGTLTVISTGDIGQEGRLTTYGISLTSGGAVIIGGESNKISSILHIAAQTGVLLAENKSKLFLDGTTSTVTGNILISANNRTTHYNVINHVGAAAISKGTGRLLIWSYDQSDSNLSGITFDATELGVHYPDLPSNPGDVKMFVRA